MDTARLQENFNFMVLTRSGEKYRTYKYDTAKRLYESEGEKFYIYAYHGLKKVVLLVDWKKK